MPNRQLPKGHTMKVVIEVLRERKGTNPILIAEVEKIAKDYVGRDSVLDHHVDRKRIEAQRTFFAMLPDSRAVDAFKRALLDRAWYLLDIGQCEACDALLEFVPSADADRMLDEYFKDEDAA